MQPRCFPTHLLQPEIMEYHKYFGSTELAFGCVTSPPAARERESGSRILATKGPFCCPALSLYPIVLHNTQALLIDVRAVIK